MKRWLLMLSAAGILQAGVGRVMRAQNADTQQPNADEYTIPEGTEFKLQLHTTVNSKTTKAGDRVISTLVDPVSVEDTDVLSKGLRVDGHVGEAKAA